MQLNAAVIGLGIGQQHVKAFDAHPACRVKTICDRSLDKLAETRQQYPHVRVTQHADEVLADEDIQIVSIASFDNDHFAQVMAALANGKHVFVEKPLCQNLAQLRQIKRAWSRHEGRVQLQSNLVLRGAPLYLWLKKQIAEGHLGRIYAFDGDYLYGRLAKITHGWRADVENYSVMAGGGIHLIDLMRWLTGERPTTIASIGNRLCTESSRFRYADYVAATLHFPSGMIGRITANFGSVHGHQHVVRIFGTHGTLLYDDQGPRMQFERDPAPPPRPLEYNPLPASKGVLIAGFLDTILAAKDLSEETQADFDTASICFASDIALANDRLQEIEYA